MPLGPAVVVDPPPVLQGQMQRPPGGGKEELEMAAVADPLAVAVLASAAGAMEIEDTEPLPAHHLCLALPEAGPSDVTWTEAPTPLAEQIPSPDSLAPPAAPAGPSWPQRARAALWRYRSVLVLAVAVLALLTGGSYACVRYRTQLLQGGDYIRRHAPLSAVYYSLIVALWIVLCLPSTIIELAAGLLYSYPVAIVCLTVGKQLGCGIAFLIARWVTSPELRSACCLPRHHRHAAAAPESNHSSGSRRSKRSRTIQAMFLALHHHPWQITFLIRLLPIPISLKNFGMGCIPGCPFHIFMACTLVAGIPFTVAWVYLGESCRSLLEALQGKGDDLTRHGAYAQELAFLIVGLVVAVALVLLLRRYTRRYTRLIAEREALAVAAAAEAAKTAEDAAVRALAGRGDVSTVSTASSTATTLLTLTPPPGARRSLTDDEEESGHGDEEAGGFTSDGGLGDKERRPGRGRRQRQRRRRSSESTAASSGLSLEISSFLLEEGEGSLETIKL